MSGIVYDFSYQEVLDKQSRANPQVYKEGGGWVLATKSQVDKYLNPQNSSSGDSLFQHVLLSYPRPITGLTADVLNKELKGSLAGKGQVFLDAGRLNNINPIYLVMHSNLEGGNGTSALATGKVEGYSGYFNVYGIGAYDGTAERSGAEYAKKQGWTSVDAAIKGGAKFVAQDYVAKGQDTLYRMRWNPANPGTHQYATDIAWASKIASRMASLVQRLGLSVGSLIVSNSSYKDNTAFTPADSKGYKIIVEAKKHLGTPYKMGGNGPDIFDCSGFVKYVYKHAIGYDMKNRTAYTQWKNEGRDVDDFYKAGDLLFFRDTYNSGNDPNVSHVAIALGEGDKFIHAGDPVNISSLSGNSNLKSKFYGHKRLLDEQETYTDRENIDDYISRSSVDTLIGLSGGLPLTQVSEYQEELVSALDLLTKSGNKECSIIDLKYGGEMKFNLPESTSESLPVSWDTSANVRGRSVPPVGYTSTGPRSLSLEIVLVAGAGYYVSKTKNPVDMMYEDIRFLQSLVYPDYSTAILQTPPLVLLSLGSALKLRGVVNSLNITYEGTKDSSNRYMKAIISLSVSQVSDEPPGLLDMRAGNIRSY